MLPVLLCRSLIDLAVNPRNHENYEDQHGKDAQKSSMHAWHVALAVLELKIQLFTILCY